MFDIYIVELTVILQLLILKLIVKKKNAQIKIIFYTADVAIPLNFFISVISFAEATL